MHVQGIKGQSLAQHPPMLHRKDIKAFSTSQRLSVMLLKTAVGYEFGCVTGALGPARLPLPAVGVAVEEPALGWKLFMLSEDIMILADCLAKSKPKDQRTRVMTHMHGILLRRLGKKRVVYLVRQPSMNDGHEPSWHSNVNLVKGVDMSWLDEAFSAGQSTSTCVVA